jgi:hypothetical protein
MKRGPQSTDDRDDSPEHTMKKRAAGTPFNPAFPAICSVGVYPKTKYPKTKYPCVYSPQSGSRGRPAISTNTTTLDSEYLVRSPLYTPTNPRELGSAFMMPALLLPPAATSASTTTSTTATVAAVSVSAAADGEPSSGKMRVWSPATYLKTITNGLHQVIVNTAFTFQPQMAPTEMFNIFSSLTVVFNDGISVKYCSNTAAHTVATRAATATPYFDRHLFKECISVGSPHTFEGGGGTVCTSRIEKLCHYLGVNCWSHGNHKIMSKRDLDATLSTEKSTTPIDEPVLSPNGPDWRECGTCAACVDRTCSIQRSLKDGFSAQHFCYECPDGSCQSCHEYTTHFGKK